MLKIDATLYLSEFHALPHINYFGLNKSHLLKVLCFLLCHNYLCSCITAALKK